MEYEILYIFFGGFFFFILLGFIIEFIQFFFFEFIFFILQDRYEIIQFCSNDLYLMVDYVVDLCIRLDLVFLELDRLEKNEIYGLLQNIKNFIKWKSF